MSEFTLLLEKGEYPLVKQFCKDLDDVLKDPLVPAVWGFSELTIGDDGLFLTADITPLWPRMSIYFGLMLFIAGFISIFFMGWSVWVLFPAFLLTLLSLSGSSYWYAYLWVIPRLRKRGYEGKIRLVMAEGIF